MCELGPDLWMSLTPCLFWTLSLTSSHQEEGVKHWTEEKRGAKSYSLELWNVNVFEHEIFKKIIK